MSDQRAQDKFPMLTAGALLTGVTALVTLPAAWLAPWAFGRPAGAGAAVLAAAATVWVSGIMGLAPVALLGPTGPMAAVWGYFIGAALRLGLCLGAVVLWVKANALPAGPLTVTLATLYLAMLAVEAALVARYLWNKDFALGHRPRPDKPGTEAPT